MLPPKWARVIPGISPGGVSVSSDIHPNGVNHHPDISHDIVPLTNCTGTYL